MSKRKIITILAVVSLVSLSIFLLLRVKTWPATIIVNNKIINVEVADNTILQQKGLSGHPMLRFDEGMLFVFQKSDKHGFWMKDMTFPLDIIWLNSNFDVVHIEKSLEPNTYPKVYYPDEPALYVLEILAGRADALNIQLGTHMEFLRN